jgi:adenosylcobinamide-phosphate synthase
LFLLPWHIACAYVLDLVLGDPQRMPHPVRWIGWLICWAETAFIDEKGSAAQQYIAGFAFWLAVVAAVVSGTMFLAGLSHHFYPLLGNLIIIWLTYSTLATRSLHQESKGVVEALDSGNLDLARRRLARIVSRDTQHLDERGIIRAVIETVSENISDGIIAPLLYLSLGGLLGGMVYKAINTMDSMVGYLNDRYRYFGWFAAKADDLANWVPSRLSGLIIILAAACLKMDWRNALLTLRLDARKMKSPNAGFPEAAAAGALGVQLGGTNWYFGRPEEKPTIGKPEKEMTVETYKGMIRLMYMSSFLAFVLALGIRFLLLQ